MDDKKKVTKENDFKEEFTEEDFGFMREKIKQRPINKGRLFRNTLVAAVSAVVFGLVACITFFVLAPIVSGLLEHDDDTNKPKLVTFPEESQDEEMQPEDMLISVPTPEPKDQKELQEKEIEKIISNISLGATEYQELYASLAEIATKAEKSIVRVTAMTSDRDWFDNLYESTQEVSGLIIADNGLELLILCDVTGLKDAEEILITFSNSIQARASIKKYDNNTSLCVLAVPLENINELTMKSITIATLGTSNTTRLSGSPVIAVGSPMGVKDSVNYGIVTAAGTKLNVVDNCYRQMTTDIYGSTSASGVIINLQGEVIGIIDTKYSQEDTANLIKAIGISELKKTIERLSNGLDTAYLGVVGTDVPQEANILQGVPYGAFVLETELDSPAMIAGLQSGDVIIKYNEIDITSFADLTTAIRASLPESEIDITVSRQVQDTNKKIDYHVTLGKIE